MHRLSALGTALSRAAEGAPLAVEDAEALLAARGAGLERVLDAASALRDEGLARAGRPRVMTYSRKVFIPLTPLCRDRCHYCVFVDTPGQLRTAARLYVSPDRCSPSRRAPAHALFTSTGGGPLARTAPTRRARLRLDAHHVGAMARRCSPGPGCCRTSTPA